jgi:negative regulator of genetic competence, sporulation and motility
LDFLKDDLRKDYIAKNREPLSIQVQALRKSMDVEIHQAKLST